MLDVVCEPLRCHRIGAAVAIEDDGIGIRRPGRPERVRLPGLSQVQNLRAIGIALSVRVIPAQETVTRTAIGVRRKIRRHIPFEQLRRHHRIRRTVAVKGNCVVALPVRLKGHVLARNGGQIRDDRSRRIVRHRPAVDQHLPVLKLAAGLREQALWHDVFLVVGEVCRSHLARPPVPVELNRVETVIDRPSDLARSGFTITPGVIRVRLNLDHIGADSRRPFDRTRDLVAVPQRYSRALLHFRIG